MKKLAFAAFGALLMIMLASCSPKTEKTVGNAPFFVNHHFDFVECDNVIYDEPKTKMSLSLSAFITVSVTAAAALSSINRDFR